uniref:Taste receptor type 2 n=1 Tax=Erpetoichthys calabaricus TaxID=27687 RepID=A0A8C4T3N4_ERPCA
MSLNIYEAITLTVTSIGMALNIVIIFATCLPGEKEETRSLPVDLILRFSAGANVFFEILDFLLLIINCFNLGNFSDDFILIIKTALYVTAVFILWSSSWICCFYCVKIVPMRSTFFLKIKQDIIKIVSFCHYGGLILYCLLTSVIVTTRWISSVNNSTSAFSSNTTFSNFVNKVNEIYPNLKNVYSVLYVLFIIISLLVMVVSSITVVKYLQKHVRIMECTLNDFSNPSLESQQRVSWMITFQVILFSLCSLFVLLNYVFSVFLLYIENGTDLMLVLSLYCFGFSASLIFGHSHLRQRMVVLVKKKAFCWNIIKRGLKLFSNY